MISKFPVLVLAIAAVLSATTTSLSGTAEARENCTFTEGERVCAGGDNLDFQNGGSGGRTTSSTDESGLDQETTGGFGSGGADQREESGGCGGQFTVEDSVVTERLQGKRC